jgi:ATPases involved in chromosome partitioning
MVRVLPVASGKGGVGKSVIAANLGLALSRLGRAVVLVDLDLGASNLHTCLGIRNKHAGLGELAWKREKTLAALLVETGYDRLWLVPGDGLLPGTANIEWFAKKKILKELESLPADYVILDLGAGSSYNVVDFFLASSEGLVVVKPEITSILNAYSLLKTSAFRILARSFPERSEGREAVNAFASIKNEGSGQSFLDFAGELARRFPDGSEALARLSRMRPRIVMNMGREASDAELGYRLRDITLKNLGMSMDFSGYLLDDPNLPASVAARTPLLALESRSPFARGVSLLARKLDAEPAGLAPALLDADARLDAGSELGALVSSALREAHVEGSGGIASGELSSAGGRIEA